LVSTNSSPAVLQPLLKKKTKIGKNNRVFPVAFLVLLLMILYILMQEHRSTSAASQPHECMHSTLEREEQSPFKFELNVNLMHRLVSHKSHAFVQAIDRICFNADLAEIYL
jgi:hypothetical protein